MRVRRPVKLSRVMVTGFSIYPKAMFYSDRLRMQRMGARKAQFIA